MKIKKPNNSVSTHTVPVFNCCIMNISANAVLMSNVIVFVCLLFVIRVVVLIIISTIFLLYRFNIYYAAIRGIPNREVYHNKYILNYIYIYIYI